MRRKQQSAISPRVEEVGQRIEQWRRTRKRRSPMPPELWDAAVSFAKAHGVCPIARALRLDYAALKSRVVQGSKGKRDGAGSFIELDGTRLLGTSEPAVVELSDAEGAKLTIRIGGQAALDVMGLASAFWRRGA